MPKWGLTAEQRKSKPWGIPEKELLPAKTITDPIHRDIFLTKLEQRAVDSWPLQRLRRVKQLGTTHLVYPGAAHSRFSHSLGALRAAQNLLDVVIDHHRGPHPTQDLFREWESKYPDQYNKMIAEATVLTRLGALLHDICHVPFGHSIEDDLGLLEPHDENPRRFDTIWDRFSDGFKENISDDLKQALRYPLILSKLNENKPHAASERYPFVADIVGNTICADLIDYLQRDHEFTGLPAKLGDRFIQGFYVTASNHKLEPQHMVLRIARDGRERRDVVSELFKYLRYRYELSERVLTHHAKLAADSMVGKLLEMWRDSLWIDTCRERFPDMVNEIESDFSEVRRRIENKYEQHVLDKIDVEVANKIEDMFLNHGDDGILERIYYSKFGSADLNRLNHSIASLADGLLNRKLFKLIGHFGNRALADRLYRKYGDPREPGSREELRDLEKRAATYAGLDHDWHVLLWIPKPSMRLKAAEVLVDDGRGVSTMLARDKAGRNRGKEIYDAHESLWSLNVYTHPTAASRPLQRKVLLAWLAYELGNVKWDGQEQQSDLAKLAAREVAKSKGLNSEQETVLAKSATGLAAHKGLTGSTVPNTFDDLVSRVSDTAIELFNLSEQSELNLPHSGG